MTKKQKLFSYADIEKETGLHNVTIRAYAKEANMKPENSHGALQLFTESEANALVEYMRPRVSRVMLQDVDMYAIGQPLPDGYKESTVQRFLYKMQTSNKEQEELQLDESETHSKDDAVSTDDTSEPLAKLKEITDDVVELYSKIKELYSTLK